VAARLRELGIRLALGATPAQLLMRVLLSGLRPALAGLAAGLAGAVLTSRLLKSQLFGLSALDPRVYAGGCAALLAIALITSLIPAYRASRLSPATVLRNE
jgi:ABC-type antimicrobial peptide transport system permease subunit